MQIDLDYFWKVFTAMVASGGVLMSAWGLYKQFKKNTFEAKQERYEKIKKENNLSKLAENADLIVQQANALKDVSEIKELLHDQNHKLEETIMHNKRQDRQIIKTNRESKVSMFTLFALVDWAQKQPGANGNITRAKEMLRNEQIDGYHQTNDDN